MPIDAWWLRLARKPGDNPDALTPVAGKGRFVLVIPREDFLQLAYIAKKGIDPQLRAGGIERFRQELAELVPWLADRVGELKSMDDVKHLDVRLNRLNRWHVDGLLCIGDAAHAMSPMGGVGINLAVQDAVAAATVLAEPLRRGRVMPANLARVRARRLLPTIVIQSLQRFMHRAFAVPIIEERRMGPPKPILAFMQRVPQASYIPAYLTVSGYGPNMHRSSRGCPQRSHEWTPPRKVACRVQVRQERGTTIMTVTDCVEVGIEAAVPRALDVA